MPNEKERLEKLLEKRRKIDANISSIEEKLKNKEKKKDTRRKILIGAFILNMCDNDIGKVLKRFSGFNDFLTRKYDREIFGLSETEQNISGKRENNDE